MATIRRKPCLSCPYVKATPPGLWAKSEYEKLRDYDRPTGEQPYGLFMCHKSALGEPSQVCRGWVVCHGRDLLAVRIALANEILEPADVDATIESAVYDTGGEAADAGIEWIEDPPAAARAAIMRLDAARRHHDGVTGYPQR